MSKIGSFTIISGPMFSGKTEELLRIANRYLIGKKKIIIFKPKRDNRYGEDIVCSHNRNTMKAREITGITSLNAQLGNWILEIYPKPDAIFLDEFQFLEYEKIEHARGIIREILNLGIDVYASGLILDSFRKPFPLAEGLLPMANRIELLTAVCNGCGCFNGEYTFRNSTDESQVLVGGNDVYTVFCAKCYNNHLTKKTTYDIIE